jgi:hypothetical protein
VIELVLIAYAGRVLLDIDRHDGKKLRQGRVIQRIRISDADANETRAALKRLYAVDIQLAERELDAP